VRTRVGLYSAPPLVKYPVNSPIVKTGGSKLRTEVYAFISQEDQLDWRKGGDVGDGITDAGSMMGYDWQDISS
jgi:hypothetical protein